MQPRRGAPSEALAVDLGYLELADIHAFQTAHVDGVHGLAVRAGAVTEAADAAGAAEEMVNVHAVELIVRLLALAGLELKLRGGHKGENGAGSGADGAVALHDLRQICADLKADF